MGYLVPPPSPEHRGGFFVVKCEYCGRPYQPSGESCLGCGAGLPLVFRATDPGRPGRKYQQPIEIEIDMSDGIDLEKFERLFKEALK